MAEGKAELHVYQREDHKWAWQLIGDNGHDIIATDGSQGYEHMPECAEMAEKIIGGGYDHAKRTVTRRL